MKLYIHNFIRSLTNSQVFLNKKKQLKGQLINDWKQRIKNGTKNF